jgi:uncharacterized protein YoxC
MGNDQDLEKKSTQQLVDIPLSDGSSVETVEGAVEGVVEEVEEVVEAVEEVAEAVEEVAEAVEEVAEAVEEVAEAVEEAADTVKEVTEAVEELTETAEALMQEMNETVEEVAEATEEAVVDESLTLHLGEIEPAASLLADVEPAPDSVFEPLLESTVECLAETSYRLVKARLAGTVVGPTTLLTVLRHTMEVVEGSIASGNEQKELAIVLVKRLVCDASMEGHDFALCVSLVDDGIIGSAIDLVVDATKGYVAVNASRASRGDCCTGFLTRARERRRARRQRRRRAAEEAQ